MYKRVVDAKEYWVAHPKKKFNNLPIIELAMWRVCMYDMC